MSVTAMFVEQVLIGGLVLAVVGLVLPAGTAQQVFGVSNGLPGQLVDAGALLGAAYLLGMVYDRCADTLMSDFERRLRLRHAARRAATRETTAWASEDDPFPEARFRVQLLKSEGGTRYADYLRSRMRLTRALATLMPALSLAFLLYLLRDPAPPQRTWWHCGVAAIPAIYSLALGVKLLKCKREPKTRLGGFLRVVRGHEPPRTDDTKDLRREHFGEHVVEPGEGEDWSCRVAWRFTRRMVRDERLFAALALLAAVGICLACTCGPRWPERLLIPVAGLVLTLVAGWSWSRIAETYFGFLDDYQRYS